jgi:hypothetical protein
MFKIFFLTGYPGTKSPILVMQLVPGPTIQIKMKKTYLVPGTKYGVFRYIDINFIF